MYGRSALDSEGHVDTVEPTPSMFGIGGCRPPQPPFVRLAGRAGEAPGHVEDIDPAFTDLRPLYELGSGLMSRASKPGSRGQTSYGRNSKPHSMAVPFERDAAISEFF